MLHVTRLPWYTSISLHHALTHAHTEGITIIPHLLHQVKCSGISHVTMRQDRNPSANMFTVMKIRTIRMIRELWMHNSRDHENMMIFMFHTYLYA